MAPGRTLLLGTEGRNGRLRTFSLAVGVARGIAAQIRPDHVLEVSITRALLFLSFLLRVVVVFILLSLLHHGSPSLAVLCTIVVC